MLGQWPKLFLVTAQAYLARMLLFHHLDDLVWTMTLVVIGSTCARLASAASVDLGRGPVDQRVDKKAAACEPINPFEQLVH